MPLAPLTRAGIRSLVYDFLGTNEDDKFYSAAKLDRHLNIAFSRLSTQIRLLNSSWYRKVQVLAADSSTSHVYQLATQAVPIVDFSRVLQLRRTDDTGDVLTEIYDDELEDSSNSCYSIIGRDEAAIITTDRSVSAGSALWLKYEYAASFDADAGDIPEGIPAAQHHLIALDATELLISLGGEAVMPKELARWRDDDKADFFLRVGKRSTDPVTARRF